MLTQDDQPDAQRGLYLTEISTREIIPALPDAFASHFSEGELAAYASSPTPFLDQLIELDERERYEKRNVSGFGATVQWGVPNPYPSLLENGLILNAGREYRIARDDEGNVSMSASTGVTYSESHLSSGLTRAINDVLDTIVPAHWQQIDAYHETLGAAYPHVRVQALERYLLE